MSNLKQQIGRNIYIACTPFLLCMLSNTSYASTYDVGTGKAYQTLNDLVNAGVLTNGDTVQLYNDDNSFVGQSFAYTSLTVQSGSGAMVELSQAQGSKPARGGIFSFTPSTVTLSLKDIQISNSTAQGNDGFISNGWGGAVYATTNLTMTDTDNVVFNNNSAIGGNGNAGNSGAGGAIYASQLNLTHANNLTFEGNQAIGGNANGLNASNSGIGGAIYIGFLGFDMTGASNIIFKNNIAQGGYADDNANADKSGLGGAIALLSPTTIAGASFFYNQATTTNTGDMSSGLGGAIYNAGPSLTLLTTAGNDIIFSGNTHNPGASGVKPNSIYFGNVSSIALNTAFTVNTESNSTVRMLDPMASQADGTTGKNGTRLLSNINLTINKNGTGTWVLGGHNNMGSATVWNINEGTLFLSQTDNSPVYINLRHATTASFTVAAGANVLMVPMATPHVISGANITFNAGSNVGINQGGAFSYFELPAGAEAPLLSLRARDSLTNNSTILNPDGSFSSGFYDYHYGLYWRQNNSLSQDLVAFIESKIYNPEVGGSSSTTAPSGIATQNAIGRMLSERLFWNFECFDNCRDTVLPATYTEDNSCNQGQCNNSHNVWAKPTYSYTTQSSGSDYTIKTPGIAVGIDNCFNQKFFLGAALFGTWPEYRSRDADIDARSLNLAIYGGTLLPGKVELGLMAAYGHTWYDQTRRVYSEHYYSDYSSDNLNLGINLGRRFQLDERWMLRPFIAYEYMQLDVNSYQEGTDTYALKVDSHKENYHFLRVGTDLTWSNTRNAYITGKIYYAGLYGDNEPLTNASFVMDTDGTTYRSYGDKLDRDSLGLGISGVWRIKKDIDLAANYNFEVGQNSHTHYGSISFIYNF